MAYEELAPVVATQTTQQAPQAYINGIDGSQLGYFGLSNHINPKEFTKVIAALNDSEKQCKLLISEGKNKNGKPFAVVRTPANVVLGILSGYSSTTLLAIQCGTAIFNDATPIDDVTSILNF